MDRLRAYSRGLLSEILEKDVRHPMVLNAETSIFNYCTRRCRAKGMPKVIIQGTGDARFLNWMYKHKVLSVTFNLKNPANPRLLQSVKSKDIECRHLGFLTREQLFPELWDPIKERLNKMDKNLIANDDVETGGMARCNKCRDKGRVHVSIVQTRSAD
jgi:hypothetical protein